MKTPARVLLIGSDRAHLQARAAILEHFWQVEVPLADPIESVRVGADVVVLLETLPEVERQPWVDRVKQEDANVLVVKINGYNSGPHAGADATVDAQYGPGALVSAIYELLTERGLGSRGWPIVGETVRVS